MIGKIKGIIHEIEGNIGLIETSGGIYYEVYLTPKILNKYTKGKKIEVYTYLQVREDAHTLFGFENRKEYSIFKMLFSVSGVGPKIAYSIISFSTPDDLTDAVKNNNVDYFTNVPGLGKKTSMKIILELSQKIETDFTLERMYLSDDDKTVLEALVSLGYKSYEAKQLLLKLPKKLSIEEKIKQALKIKK